MHGAVAFAVLTFVPDVLFHRRVVLLLFSVRIQNDIRGSFIGERRGQYEKGLPKEVSLCENAGCHDWLRGQNVIEHIVRLVLQGMLRQGEVVNRFKEEGESAPSFGFFPLLLVLSERIEKVIQLVSE